MSRPESRGQPGPFLVDRIRELVQGVTEDVRGGLVGSPYETLRVSQLTLLAQLPREGSRLTDLAERMQVSKQYVDQLVDGLEVMGILERVRHPSDGRARIVRPTRFALRGYVAGHRLLRSIHADWREALGARGYRLLSEAIDRLLELRSEGAPAKRPGRRVPPSTMPRDAGREPGFPSAAVAIRAGEGTWAKTTVVTLAPSVAGRPVRRARHSQAPRRRVR